MEQEQQQQQPLSIESIEQEIKQLVDNDKTISCIQHPNGTIVILVGTAHVSLKSSNLVSKLISHFKPKKIFIELCNDRRATLQLDNEDNGKARKKGQRNIKNAQDFFQTLLSEFQANSADKLKVKVGEEFRVAYHEGRKHGGVPYLFDRPVRDTLNRFWSSLRTKFEKYLFIQQLVLEFIVTSFLPSSYLNDLIERMTDGGIDIVELVKEMAEQWPTFSQIILEERNIWMSYALQVNCEPQDRICIAVIGYAHVHGIKDCFQYPIIPNCKPLQILQLKSNETNVKYPGFSFDIDCFKSPSIKSRSFLSKTKFRIKTLVLKLNFHIGPTINDLNGNVYLRIISTKEDDDDDDNSSNARNVIKMVEKNNSEKNMAIFHYQDDNNTMHKMKLPSTNCLRHYHYNNINSSKDDKNPSDFTLGARLNNSIKIRPFVMSKSSDASTKPTLCCYVKLSFQKPIDLKSFHTTVILDDNNYNMKNVELFSLIGSHVGDDENYAIRKSNSGEEKFDDLDDCIGPIYKGPIWGKSKTKTLSAYIFVGWCITSYLLQ